MRLLHTRTLRFKEFFIGERPQYCILSHVWQQAGEVSYKEYLQCLHGEDQRYAKIYGFCEYARARGFQWCWIDTCCINKDSLTELSEAINMMFKWYQDSRLCVVHLSDVTTQSVNDVQFRQSSWFTRGFTLQELLGPLNLDFVTCDWQCFGVLRKLRQLYSFWSTVDFPEIVTVLAEITNIPEEYLAMEAPWLCRAPSVAQIMSWASSRKTSRPEDMAYCLLGLFDINMPLLYGEGQQALRRLQKKLIKSRADGTIFHWTNGDAQSPMLSQGMIAPSLRCFRNSGTTSWNARRSKAACTWTSSGITYTAQARRLIGMDNSVLGMPAWNCEFYLVETGCHKEEEPDLPCTLILSAVQGSEVCQRLTPDAFKRMTAFEVAECVLSEAHVKRFLIEIEASLLPCVDVMKAKL